MTDVSATDSRIGARVRLEKDPASTTQVLERQAGVDAFAHRARTLWRSVPERYSDGSLMAERRSMTQQERRVQGRRMSATLCRGRLPNTLSCRSSSGSFVGPCRSETNGDRFDETEVAGRWTRPSAIGTTLPSRSAATLTFGSDTGLRYGSPGSTVLISSIGMPGHTRAFSLLAFASAHSNDRCQASAFLPVSPRDSFRVCHRSQSSTWRLRTRLYDAETSHVPARSVQRSTRLALCQ